MKNTKNINKVYQQRERKNQHKSEAYINHYLKANLIYIYKRYKNLKVREVELSRNNRIHVILVIRISFINRSGTRKRRIKQKYFKTISINSRYNTQSK